MRRLMIQFRSTTRCVARSASFGAGPSVNESGRRGQKSEHRLDKADFDAAHADARVWNVETQGQEAGRRCPKARACSSGAPINRYISSLLDRTPLDDPLEHADFIHRF